MQKSKITVMTASFKDYKKLVDQDITPVRISRGAARWIKGIMPTILSVAPTFPMLKMTQKQYNAEFMRILSEVEPKDFIQQVEQIAKDSGSSRLAILCFEPTSEFCHRHMVADWCNANGLFENRVVEFGHSDKEYDSLIKWQRKTFYSECAIPVAEKVA